MISNLCYSFAEQFTCKIIALTCPSVKVVFMCGPCFPQGLTSFTRLDPRATTQTGRLNAEAL